MKGVWEDLEILARDAPECCHRSSIGGYDQRPEDQNVDRNAELRSGLGGFSQE